jgi:hypothetical protein
VDATIQEAARLMAKHDRAELPVIDSDSWPIGVISERDITRRQSTDHIRTAGDIAPGGADRRRAQPGRGRRRRRLLRHAARPPRTLNPRVRAGRARLEDHDGRPLRYSTTLLASRSISGVSCAVRAGSAALPRLPLRRISSMRSFISAISRTCDSMI